jgi:outer membrane protein assembly factor BamD
MFRRIAASFALGFVLLMIAGCHRGKVVNPIANVNSKQPDKVLFDRAMEAMKKGKYDVARITLQTLINTYPDSEYVARAKLSVADSWYAEGGGTGLQQAEIEYKDFITFFPNMPEAAEAQLKVANIHYRQMEKPDRDYTHAKRAEDEYRTLIQQFPDSKLVPQAKERLREVQEVLAEREYRIGRFYFLRESYAAAIARLKSVTDTYPLYSKADDGLMMLGSSYERQIEAIRNNAGIKDEAARGRAINMYKAHAAEVYGKVITRYPVGGLADKARERLKALQLPVPEATPEAIALNKTEEDSRGRTGRFGKLMLNFHKGPDMATAAKTGEPTLTDPEPTSAPAVVQQSSQELLKAIAGGGAENNASVEVVGKGAPPANAAPPRSDAAPGEQPAGQPPAAGTAQPNAPSTTRPVVPDNTGIEDLAAPGNTQPANAAPATQPSSTPPAVTHVGPIDTAAPTAAQPNAQPAAPSATAPAPPTAPAQVNDASSASDESVESCSPNDKNCKDSSSLKKKKKKKTKDHQ